MVKTKEMLKGVVGAVMSGIGQKRKQKNRQILFGFGARCEDWSEEDSLEDVDFRPSDDDNDYADDDTIDLGELPKSRKVRNSKTAERKSASKPLAKKASLHKNLQKTRRKQSPEKAGTSKGSTSRTSSIRSPKSKYTRVVVGDDSSGDDKYSSDDSDYLNENESTSAKRNVLPKRKKPQRKVVMSTSPAIRSPQNTTKQGCIEKWSGEGNSLFPPEVWIRIFQLLLKDICSMPTLLKLGFVCRQFRWILQNEKSLWADIDMDTGRIKQKQELLSHISQRANAQTHTIKFSNWKKMKDDSFRDILSAAPNIQSLSLSFCQNLSPKSLDTIVAGLTNLSKLNLSFCSVKPSGTFGTSLLTFLKNSAPKLKRLYLNGNYVGNIHKILQLSNEWLCAPELEVLDISGVQNHRTSGTVSLEKLADSTPLLVEFHFANSPVVFDYDSQPTQPHHVPQPKYWTHLEDIDMSYIMEGYSAGKCASKSAPCHTFLHWLLRECDNLKRLNAGGHEHAIQWLAEERVSPLIQLTHFHASKCGSMDVPTSIPALKEKLCARLKDCEDLDVSWFRGEEQLLWILGNRNGFSETVLPKLQRLNLSGSTINTASLRNVLNSSPKLDWLDVSSCRSLTPGVKRIFQSRPEILDLMSQLKK